MNSRGRIGGVVCVRVKVPHTYPDPIGNPRNWRILRDLCVCQPKIVLDGFVGVKTARIAEFGCQGYKSRETHTSKPTLNLTPNQTYH